MTDNGRYQAVLFDLDGTLLDTIGDIADSMNLALQNRDLPQNDEETYKTFIGQGIREFVTRSIPANKSNDELVLSLIGEMRAEYHKRWNNKTCPYTGIPELLNDLSHRNIRMAVLSNKPDDFTKMMIREMLPEWHFELVIGARKNVPRKPDPAGAIEIAEKFNLSPAQCVYVGDSETDIEMAISAGMLPVGVSWGFRTKNQLTESGAVMVLDKPPDLLEVM